MLSKITLRTAFSHLLVACTEMLSVVGSTLHGEWSPLPNLPLHLGLQTQIQSWRLQFYYIPVCWIIIVFAFVIIIIKGFTRYKEEILMSPGLWPPSPNNHLKHPLILGSIRADVFEEVIHPFNNCHCQWQATPDKGRRKPRVRSERFGFQTSAPALTSWGIFINYKISEPGRLLSKIGLKPH